MSGHFDVFRTIEQVQPVCAYSVICGQLSLLVKQALFNSGMPLRQANPLTMPSTLGPFQGVWDPQASGLIHAPTPGPVSFDALKLSACIEELQAGPSSQVDPQPAAFSPGESGALDRKNMN
jgi:hypothetical protein